MHFSRDPGQIEHDESESGSEKLEFSLESREKRTFLLEEVRNGVADDFGRKKFREKIFGPLMMNDRSDYSSSSWLVERNLRRRKPDSRKKGDPKDWILKIRQSVIFESTAEPSFFSNLESSSGTSTIIQSDDRSSPRATARFYDKKWNSKRITNPGRGSLMPKSLVQFVANRYCISSFWAKKTVFMILGIKNHIMIT